jgi:ATP-dependent Clp protease ATP-binding subunit ClpC
MFERFSDGARQTMGRARREAQRLGSGFIDSEHIVLGFLEDPRSRASRILEHLGIDPHKLRSQGEQRIPMVLGRPTPSQMPFSPHAKSLIESAARVAAELKHDYIASSHFLVADLEDPRGLLPVVLPGMGFDPGEVLLKTREMLADL